jgi:hypothetical protein
MKPLTSLFSSADDMMSHGVDTGGNSMELTRLRYSTPPYIKENSNPE